jgi:hypothetical protein
MSLADTFERNFKTKWYSGSIENIPLQERWQCFDVLLKETISDKWWKGNPHENITPFPHLSKDIDEVKIGHEETIAKYCKDPKYKCSGKPDWRDMLENFAESVSLKRKDEWKREFLKIYPKEKVDLDVLLRELKKEIYPLSVILKGDTRNEIDDVHKLRKQLKKDEGDFFLKKRLLESERLSFNREKQELKNEKRLFDEVFEEAKQNLRKDRKAFEQEKRELETEWEKYRNITSDCRRDA